MKKNWKRPEMVVLKRSRSDEAILIVCKDSWGAGPAATSCLSGATPPITDCASTSGT